MMIPPSAISIFCQDSQIWRSRTCWRCTGRTSARVSASSTTLTTTSPPIRQYLTSPPRPCNFPPRNQLKRKRVSLPKSFSTTSRASDPLRDSLVKRAKKRTVRPKADPGWWAVSGSASLGDAYDSYDVRLRDDGSYWCSCEGNRGGEFRKARSHKTAVVM